jgi:hypothetical protein
MATSQTASSIKDLFAGIGAVCSAVMSIGGLSSIADDLRSTIKVLEIVGRCWKSLWYPAVELLNLRLSNVAMDSLAVALGTFLAMNVTAYLFHRRTLVMQYAMHRIFIRNGLRKAMPTWQELWREDILKKLSLSLANTRWGLAEMLKGTKRSSWWSWQVLLFSGIFAGFYLFAALLFSTIFLFIFLGLLVWFVTYPPIRFALHYPRTAFATVATLSVVIAISP